MTGFARAHGTSGAYGWAWELKSVNAKGLDLRLRLPPGWDALETPVRARAAEAARARHCLRDPDREPRGGAARGTRERAGAKRGASTMLRGLAGRVEAAPPSLDGILGLKGVIEVTDADESEEERRAAEAAIVAGFGQALAEPCRHAPA